MPELPEVETVARQLAPALVGRRLRSVRILDPRLREGPMPRLAGRLIEDVRRMGKQVVIRCSAAGPTSGPVWAAVHLRMTGRLIWSPDGDAADRKTLRAWFGLDGGKLLFHDTRRFGTLRWHRSADEAAPAGIEPLDPALDTRRLGEVLGTSRQCLKVWLLRQDRLVGLGNIYASEILHRARLSPSRPAGSLDRAETARLLRATRGVLRRAIACSGTTFSDFQDSRGLTGSYARFLDVYAREGEPCRRCRTPLRRVVQSQRSTFYCPACQK